MSRRCSKAASTAVAGMAGSRRSRLMAVPMICSTRAIRLSPPGPATLLVVSAAPAASAVGTIERRLERRAVGLARVGRSRDRVDLRALGLERLVVEDRLDELADLERAAAIERQLQRLDVGDLAAGLDQADLDVAEPGGDDARRRPAGFPCSAARWTPEGPRPGRGDLPMMSPPTARAQSHVAPACQGPPRQGGSRPAAPPAS